MRADIKKYKLVRFLGHTEGGGVKYAFSLQFTEKFDLTVRPLTF